MLNAQRGFGCGSAGRLTWWCPERSPTGFRTESVAKGRRRLPARNQHLSGAMMRPHFPGERAGDRELERLAGLMCIDHPRREGVFAALGTAAHLAHREPGLGLEVKELRAVSRFWGRIRPSRQRNTTRLLAVIREKDRSVKSKMQVCKPLSDYIHQRLLVAVEVVAFQADRPRVGKKNEVDLGRQRALRMRST